jgi:regulator of nonsense transcripts 1
VVVLLHALAITTDALMKKQDEFFDLLQAAWNGNIRATFQFLSFLNYFDLGERLLLEGFSSISGIVRSKVQGEYSKMSRQRGGSQRCRIMISKSRLLFGVCDPTSKAGATPKLKAGTCFVRITSPESGQAQTIVNTHVLVTRNPCLHPGDLQKFEAVEVREFSHLVDCIVFPTVGKRPSVDQMSGGDLDGDKFIVIWDPDVVPATLAQPADYPHPKQVMRPANMSGDGRADYFAQYSNHSISRLKALHMLWARLKGPMSPECQELNRLHSQSLDGFEVSVPSRLGDPPQSVGNEQPFILDILHRAAEERIKVAKVKHMGTLDLPVDAMSLLLSRDAIAIHEFDLIQITLKWCRRYDENLLDYAGFFNFGALSDDQQKWLLGELPQSKSGPSIVKNGLHQSHIVTSHELRRFQIDYHGFHWKRVFDSSSDRMGRFMTSACQSLELFHKKLILFKPDTRLVLAIYVPSKIPIASETNVGTSVRVFALPQSKGSDSTTYRVRPTTVKYRLYHDEANFWLYDDKRQNTFIYLTRGPMDKSSFKNLENKGDRRRQKQATIDASINFDCRASIALDKISKDIQDHVGLVRRAGIHAAVSETGSSYRGCWGKILDELTRSTCLA